MPGQWMGSGKQEIPVKNYDTCMVVTESGLFQAGLWVLFILDGGRFRALLTAPLQRPTPKYDCHGYKYLKIDRENTDMPIGCKV